MKICKLSWWGITVSLFLAFPLWAATSEQPSITVPDAIREVARTILDENKPAAERDALLAQQSGKRAELVAAMASNMPSDINEEYRRIPWIWKASIAAGKANDAAELKKLLAVSMPGSMEPLRDWQAVVIGGGIINGITQHGSWPDERLREIMRGNKDLSARWKRVLDLAATMADDEKVKMGTRYDALRILGVDTWERRGGQLLKYLDRNINDELQMGAVSGLGDMRSPKVAKPLVDAVEFVSDHNRQLALDALMRDESRTMELLEAIADNRLKKSMLSEARLQKLINSNNKTIRAQAETLFKTRIPVAKRSRDYLVGLASVDITPKTPVRLSGYAVRKTESEGIEQRIFAKAMAIGSDREGVALLLTVDNVGVPDWIRKEVLKRLSAKARIKNEELAVCSTHTHSAPMLKDNLATLFGEDIPAEHQQRIDAYSAELVDKIEQVAIAALNDRQPAKLFWGKTKAGFAANRRTAGGPVDHDVPVLFATDKEGYLRGIFANYACHCTTLGGDFNEVCGDWAGYAQEYIERDNRGVIALVGIGCGADANPAPRPGLEHTQKHGQSIASAVNQLLGGELVPLSSKLECRAKQISLPFDKLPSTQEWEERAKKQDYAGYHARKVLERLDKGELLPTELPYLVQTWNFGDQLAMVFLPGEVVVDYSLRLKKEYDPQRMWVNAYANDVPCYIPSKRIWTEGGYEGGGAMIFYDKPTRLAENTEEMIFSALHSLIPKQFAASTNQSLQTQSTSNPAVPSAVVEEDPESPEAKEIHEVYKTFQRKTGFVVNVMASEPLIVDPVAIDFSTDGKLWVLEMHDYPNGMDGNLKPGGRVKLIQDTNGDGEYDQGTTFLDELSFPTGLMQWRNGVLVCAAPDILYAEDTNGDGKADIVKKLFTGFATHNYQARVNSLRWGLDNWVYGAGGIFGGKIKSELTGEEIECSGRDFRMNPDTGAFEPVHGISQQGRARDDWGNWFGCDNSTLLWHFPLPDRYVRRNPHVTPPDPRIYPVKDSDPNLLFPTSKLLERFNNPNSANRATSVSGLEIYRDTFLGEQFYGDSFSGETVHNLVRRFELTREGATFTAKRPADEQKSEFFASTDNWFRPVEIRTGPDGALWIVDMYRFVIEHPRWIPAERLAKLEVRAGDDKGRIYRTYPYGKDLRPVRDLTKVSGLKLATLLDTPNGTMRDLVHREIYQRQEKSAIPTLKKLARDSRLPAVRVQAMWALDGLNSLWPEDVYNGLIDSDANVRVTAIRLSEDFLSNGRTSGRDRISDLGWNPAFRMLKDQMSELVNDPEYAVRFQLALSMGEWPDSRAAKILGQLATKEAGDKWMRAAVLSSAMLHVADILRDVVALEEGVPGREELIAQLVATAAGDVSNKALLDSVSLIAPSTNQPVKAWQLTALANLLETLDRRKVPLSIAGQFSGGETRAAIGRIEAVIKTVGDIARDNKATLEEREAAVRLLSASENEKDIQTLIEFATSSGARLQKAAQSALRRQKHAKVPELLLAGWKNYLVSVRPVVLEIMLSREEGMSRVLQGVESGVIAVSEVPATSRQQLIAHENKKISDRASALFPKNESRQAVLAKFSAEVPKLTGNAERGAQVFAESCANCHAFRGQGTTVGPDMTLLSNKSIDDFLLAILDPNSVIEPRFVQYNFELKDERSLSGVISAETATSVTVIAAGGVKETVLRSDIAEMRASSLSLMPEGLEEGRTAQHFADLIAYLKATPGTFGQQTSEQAKEARKKFIEGGAPNGVAQVVNASEKLDYTSWIGQLPFAHCRQNDGKSKVVWETAPVQGELKPDQFYNFRIPAGMGLLSQPPGKFSLNVNGKIVLYFDVTLADKTWSSADGKVSMRYQVMDRNTEDSSGILTIGIKGSMLELNKPVRFEVTGSAAGSQRWFGVYVLPPEQRASR